MTKFDEIIKVDLGNRGLKPIFDVMDSDFDSIVNKLKDTKGTVYIVTGFFIPGPNAAETDGPVGAIILSYYLKFVNIDCVILTDRFCLDSISKTCDYFNVTCTLDLPDLNENDFLLYLERCGPNKNGDTLNMRGVSISDHNDPLHLLLENHICNSAGIGDGGNEIGCGKYYEAFQNSSINKEILCKISTDFLLLAGVSNWAAYALAIAISGPNYPIYEDFILMHRNILSKFVENKGVDGVTKQNACTIDGMSLEVHEQIIFQLFEIIA
eukprot:TRINITY_DN631_c0_g1_i1.p1 TRINITY_DN631_c0_g1~~TRINITY_DN631_c0_g1_i1.p1  ORF type:complete len:268 (-),score=69.17 TRINITY_DN631_c0_g1_i1:175-978(-)